MNDITNYLSELTQAHRGIKEVWLLGSRANGTARPNSDWDLFVFADEATLQQLRTEPRFRRSDVDLLVVRDDDEFFEPWGDDPKRGYLSEWNWTKSGVTEATYYGTKRVEDKGRTRTVLNKYNAVLIWPAGL